MNRGVKLRRFVCAALIAGALIMTEACGGPRSILGPPESPCFRELPTAFAAVHRKGKLIGVRRVKPRVVATQLPEAGERDALCLFAYKDHYRPGDVTGARVQRAGTYAIVAVRSRTRRFAGAFVTDKLPFRFTHPV